ncbi:hypothetical protein GDO86_013035 [Hymenochirus boettgeri]|uniref:DUF4585 domain-containing protein n=1 Tax=Hymenochirus boettgeri TaxID=247094 RepID=A0A8T2IV35_9PIPI|nr:hypothetical protein GDO86_013035 [Hymenochirus boettgeri]
MYCYDLKNVEAGFHHQSTRTELHIRKEEAKKDNNLLQSLQPRALKISRRKFLSKRMLRYKKHKRLTDGLGASGLGVMDDTDREVSSFTDRAFRSLCVAEEEPCNDVPHLPSPIRDMPLSTKYHLGIFNLSVRKTQPLAQLPILPGQRGKWAPTFQPLLNCRREGGFNAKTNNEKIVAPEPREYKQQSKVSSLIKTFDNIENERPSGSPIQPRFPLRKSAHKEDPSTEDNIGDLVLYNDIENGLTSSTKQEEFAKKESPRVHRRTARDVFLESQADKCSVLSGSPCSLGSALDDISERLVKQSSRRTRFLHSENSAFKSWSDIYKRGDDSDCSLPGTPPIRRSVTPRSPLLPRTIPGIRTRDGGLDFGWTSPASTASSNYDAVHVLRSVPPLPSKRAGKQNREHKNKNLLRVPVDNKIQEEEMQIDVEPLPCKDDLSCIGKSKEKRRSESPLKSIQDQISKKYTETLDNVNPVKQTEEVKAKEVCAQLERTSDVQDIVPNDVAQTEHIPSSGRIKSLIEQIEKETVKATGSPIVTEQKYKIHDLQKDEQSLNSIDCALSPSNNPPPQSVTLVPPWRRKKNTRKTESDNFMPQDVDKTILSHNNKALDEDVPEDKPTNSSFNITNLLTPVIRRKNIQEALEELPMITTPPPAEVINVKEQNTKEVSVYQKRDDYKSKATGLMFNLKDMRKRVKSTYNPAIPVRNWRENILVSDVRLNENANITSPIVSPSKEENDNITPMASMLNSRMVERENQADLNGAVADNYLSLSSPQQTNGSLLCDNAEAIAGESTLSASVEQTVINPKEKHHIDSSLVQPVEETILHSNKTEGVITSDSSSGSMRFSDALLNKDTANISLRQELVHPTEDLERKIESDEKGKIEESKNGTKDELQYYDLSSYDVEGRSQKVGLDIDSKKKGTEEALSETDQKFDDKVYKEEHQRPASITLFKPNLFKIKDNKVKSSPVTKSVRLPLLRSLSEDSLAFRKGDVIILSEDRGAVRKNEKNPRHVNNIKPDLICVDNDDMDVCSREKVRELVGIRPASEIPIQECFDVGFLKMQRRRAEYPELWKKLSLKNSEWNETEIDKSEMTKLEKGSFDLISAEPEEPFIHPLETCVSEVPGPSPETNTFFVQDINDPINDIVNGDIVNSSLNATEDTPYSPLDSSLLHYEDAVAFSEDIACSTVTSPMLESVTCSIPASPMSVITQSSGFTTALSALDELPSPTSATSNSRKALLATPEKLNALEENAEAQTREHPRLQKEKVSITEPQNMNTGKPPAVPPKTEKALRRAKRLTKKRRKTELPQKTQDGELPLSESDFVLDVPSPGSITPTLPAHLKVTPIIQQESISSSSTPTFPVTQRKLLQDPVSGQYFVVDIPVHFQLKTFYDPETGKYLQVSLPPSETGSPNLDIRNGPFMLCPGLSPLPVSSISLLKVPSQALSQVALENQELKDCWVERNEVDSLIGQKYIESAYESQEQSLAGTPQSMDRIPSRPRSPDIISIKDLDEFAIEAIS